MSLRRMTAALSMLAVLAAATTACTPDGQATSAGTPGSAAAKAPSNPQVVALIRRGIAAKPYSAAVRVTTDVSGTTALSMDGRLNLNGPLSGTLTMKVGTGTPSAKTIEQVLTARGFYMRQADGTAVPSGPWQKVDPARTAGGLPNLSLGKYAEILALQDGADKGTETVAGVRAHRLSGRVGIEQVRTLEPGLYDRLRAESLDGFQCDTWVDEAGRVVKLEQWLKIQGTKAHNTFTLGSFGPVLSVAAPTAS